MTAPDTLTITLPLLAVMALVIGFGLGFLAGGVFITANVNRAGFRWKIIAGKVRLVKKDYA